jgi:hypothetical protein
MRTAGVSDQEIIEYLKAANAAMNAVLDDLSLSIAGGRREEARKCQQ